MYSIINYSWIKRHTIEANPVDILCRMVARQHTNIVENHLLLAFACEGGGERANGVERQ